MTTQNKEYTPMELAHMRSSFYATKPTRGTVMLRTFLPWQLWRFFRINLRMFSILRRSHKQL
jgi:hypothetical protein